MQWGHAGLIKSHGVWPNHYQKCITLQHSLLLQDPGDVVSGSGERCRGCPVTGSFAGTGFDPIRDTVSGFSAGGNLARLAATRLLKKVAGSSSISAVIAMYPLATVPAVVRKVYATQKAYARVVRAGARQGLWNGGLGDNLRLSR